LKIGKCSKWFSLFAILATLVSMLLMQAGMASAATLQPSINPAGGTYTSTQTVTIYNIANGDTAYYTTDGSNPETSSTRIAYSGPFSVYQSETVLAVSYDSTTGWSTVTSAVFYFNGSSYQPGSISTQISQLEQELEAAINDGQMSQSTQILQQIQQLETQNTNQTSLQAPVISPDGGSYSTAQTVTIGDIYGTAYYTTDGSNPETSSTRIAYSAPFTVYQSETIEAVNQDQYGNWSTVTSAVFDIGNSNSSQLQPGYQQQHGRRIRLFARGKEINFDVQPIIMNGHTLIPIRQIAAALGLPDNDVQWNTNGTVTINNGSHQMIIRNNEQQVYLDGNAYASDAPAQILKGRMMVPLRAISQLFNKNVQWDSSSGTITIQ